MATILGLRTVSRFGPQNLGAAGLLSLGLKTQMLVGWFPGLGLKTGGWLEKAAFPVWATKPGVQSEGGTWRQSGGCVEATLRVVRAWPSDPPTIELVQNNLRV